MGVVFESEENKVEVSVDSLAAIADSYILDYIKSTGTQYFNMPIFTPTEDMIEIELKNSEKTNICGLYGLFSEFISRAMLLLGTLEENHFNVGSPDISNVSPRPFNGHYNIRVDFKENTFRTITVPTGLVMKGSIATGERPTAREARLLTVDGYVDNKKLATELMVFKQSRNGKVIHHQLPCEKADGTICLWDITTNTYNLNAGTGEFIAGNKIGYVKDGIAYNMNGTIYTGN